MDQLPRLGKRELICLLSFTCNYVVFVWRGFLFLWVLGMGYVILLWHSLSLPYNYFDVCCPETISCASKPLLLRYNLVIPQCMCQVSLRLKEVQMGTHDFKYNKVPIFGRKTGDINTSMFAAPKLALVPASRYYCDVA